MVIIVFLRVANGTFISFPKKIVKLQSVKFDSDLS